MVAFYIDKVMNDDKKVEDIPSLWRKKVEEKLKEMQS